MYKRLIILSVIIVAALCGLAGLGYHAVEKWAEGLEWKRLGEFAEVAEQIRQDVKRKLDEFMQTEGERPYSHYQHYYVPDEIAAGQRDMPVLPSPLSGRLEHGVAYGHFQIEPDGDVLTPNDYIVQEADVTSFDKELSAATVSNRFNIENNLLPVLNGVKRGSLGIRLDKKAIASPAAKSKDEMPKSSDSRLKERRREEGIETKAFPRKRGKALPIESLQKSDQKAQVIRQQRAVALTNVAANEMLMSRQAASQASAETQLKQTAEERQAVEKEMYAYSRTDGTSHEGRGMQDGLAEQAESSQLQVKKMAETAYMDVAAQLPARESQNDTVQVRIEPFVPIVVGGGDTQKSIFGGQVFLLRHVQIEDRHFQQGFQLNEERLVEEVIESAARFIREGMSFELPQIKDEQTESQIANGVTYTAILDFGFGDLILNLKEIDTARIGKQINQLRNWYLSIVAIVLFAVTLGLVSLWRNARGQLKLAQKKDDFISAVSHELRTPLTSIRMYSEMLEKNWVKSEDKLAEYYRNMRQESERLSRLIENVLDFSRIQKGRKKYAFSVGNLNECIVSVVEMMRPYAAQNSFSIKIELEQLGQTAFDKDAVKQIVVNLLDNAIKYARDAKDKTITVRTKSDSQFILIEVEDHGPGVPHRQRKKIFEEFYRLGPEATRETTGTGLGLALVKKFAQAHNGFVEILTAKPAGAIFRVGLAMQS